MYIIYRNDNTILPVLGSLRDVVTSQLDFWFDEKNQLVFKYKYSKTTCTLHSYSDEWSNEEKSKDALKELVKILKNHGYIIGKIKPL